MVLFTYDRVDTELIKQLQSHCGSKECDAVHSGDVIAACAQYPVMRHVMRRQVPSLRLKSRDWLVKVQMEMSDDLTTPRRIVNFAATRNNEVVWARPNNKDYIIAASSTETFLDFMKSHYDVLVYYFMCLYPETQQNII